MDENQNELHPQHHALHFDKKHLLIFGVVAVAVLGFLVSRKAVTPSTSGNTTDPTYSNAGMPVYYTTDGTGTDWSSGSIGGGSSTTGVLTPPSTPSPVVLTPPPSLAAPPSSLPSAPNGQPPLPPILGAPPTPQSAPQYIQAINDYAQATPNRSAQTTQQLHDAKVVAAAQVGKSVDDWGIVRNNSTGTIDTGASAKFSSIAALNEYATENAGKLSQADLATLHQQKIGMAAAQGYTVTADGSVFTSTGKPVGANGRG